MPEAERDADPVEPPQANEADAPQIADLLATIEAYRLENEVLRAAAAERAQRDTEHWMPLKPAAGGHGMPYQDALAWAKRAIAAGRLNEARKPRGRVEVNLTELAAHFAMKTAK